MAFERGLLPGEYAALGFIAEEPLHGYELARRWASSPLSRVCAAEQSVIYGYLRNLERRALLDWEDLRVGNRPPRRIYELNEEGWSVLRAWLHAPVERMREVRLDLLLKLYFLERLDPHAIPALVERQVAVCRRYVEREERRLAESEGFDRVVGQSRLSAGRATLSWLANYLPPEPRDRRVAS